MALLKVTLAPNPIFKQQAKPVERVDAAIQQIANDMLETMYHEHAVGLGANMVNVPWRIVTLDLRENDINKPYVMINPEILEYSQETNKFEEASLSFPGISADVIRPSKIKVKYLDQNGELQTLEADHFLARVIQHEVDYLNGITFLDHLSKMKRDMLMNKMTKFLKNYTPHVHGEHCHH